MAWERDLMVVYMSWRKGGCDAECSISFCHPRLADLDRESLSSSWSWCHTCLHCFAWHSELMQGWLLPSCPCCTEGYLCHHLFVHSTLANHLHHTWSGAGHGRHTNKWMAPSPPGAHYLELKRASSPEVAAPRNPHTKNKTLLTWFTLHTFDTETSTNSVGKLHLNIGTKMWFPNL